MRIITAVSFFLSLVISGNMFAADNYAFDKAHTNILMKVSHRGFSDFYLEARDYTGAFILDESQPENSSVSIEIKADSIDGDHEKLNAHLRSEDFFDVANYPLIRFESKRVETEANKIIRIHGDLTIKSVTKTVTLNVTGNKTGINPFSKKYIAGFSANTVIKRSAYTMDYGVPGIGDEVEILIELEGIKQ